MERESEVWVSTHSYKSVLVSLNPDGYCGVCEAEQNFSTCGCCTICWMLICQDCEYIFEEHSLYTFCKKKNCVYIHKLIHKMFIHEIAVIIAQKLHEPSEPNLLGIFNNFPKVK